MNITLDLTVFIGDNMKYEFSINPRLWWRWGRQQSDDGCMRSKRLNLGPVQLSKVAYTFNDHSPTLPDNAPAKPL